MASLDDVAVMVGRLQGTVEEGFSRLDGRVDDLKNEVSALREAHDDVVDRVVAVESECASRKAAQTAQGHGMGIGLKVGLLLGGLFAGAGVGSVIVDLVKALSGN